MIINSIFGYDTSYRYGDGKSPEIDQAVDTLNKITMPYGSGLVNVDGNGEVVTSYTNNVGLRISDKMPEEISLQAKGAVFSIIQLMNK